MDALSAMKGPGPHPSSCNAGSKPDRSLWNWFSERETRVSAYFQKSFAAKVEIIFSFHGNQWDIHFPP